MKEVIYINKPEVNETPVVFTHLMTENGGWVKTSFTPGQFDQVAFLGTCRRSGDMFSTVRGDGTIAIFKGCLNSGKY